MIGNVKGTASKYTDICTSLDHLFLDATSKLGFFLLTPPALPFHPIPKSIDRTSFCFPVLDFIKCSVFGGIIRGWVMSYSICKGLKIGTKFQIFRKVMAKLPTNFSPEEIQSYLY